jgi:lipoate-protein ligase A
MKLNYLLLNTTDPDFNLAAEQYVFDCLPRDRMYLMLWQNDNAIIIGKHQNTAAEINADFVRDKGIRVVRRLSGGGAVYHDLGNLNYTLIADAEGAELDLGVFCRPVIHALQKLGVDARLNGRNDMTIGDKKFSGNAQYRREGRVMHHGTLLFDSDMSVLAGALRVDEEKIKTKGVRSVRSRVTNIRPHLPKDMTLPDFRQNLLACILEEMPGEEYSLTEADLAAIEAIRRERYSTWEWNFGRSPACDLSLRCRFEGCGTVEAFLTLDHGCLKHISFHGDYFSAADPAALEALLSGCQRTPEALALRLQETDVSRYFHGLTATQLISLLCS